MVNSFTEEREAIETRFGNTFDTYITPVQYDNVEFLKQGDSIVHKENNLDAWVRLSILNDDALQTEVGNSRTRMFGTIVASIFVKENKGSRLARQIADEIFPIYNGVRFDGIQAQATSMVTTPPLNGWYQLTLSTDYYWDLCHV